MEKDGLPYTSDVCIDKSQSLTAHWGIKCNFTESHGGVPAGAKAWLINPNRGDGCDRMQVYARSGRGRHVKVWVARHMLINFRSGWITDELQNVVACFLIRKDADDLVAEIMRVAPP